jgi:4-diphosphocytidyl-2-C-methyl-D-erythritol kinase
VPTAATCLRVPSFAKINLDLRVLHKRADGYHELRTIFQTVNLHDSLEVKFERSRRTQIELEASIEIPDNLVLRAARAVLEHMQLHARIRFRLTKRIPVGAGLGGGSSNAAAVLIALPALAGRPVGGGELAGLAGQLGSDVPFFLHGGTALGLGRGTELYPLPDLPAVSGLLVASGIHVSTAEAYRALNRAPEESRAGGSQIVTNALTTQGESPILGEFRAVAWALRASRICDLAFRNDFEEVVFERHPELRRLVGKLRRLGANPARMTGSGSAVFGLFASREEARLASLKFPASTAFPFSFVPRSRYESSWRRALGPAFEHSVFAASGGARRRS